MANGRTSEGRSTCSGTAAAIASASANPTNPEFVRQTIAETLEAPRLQGLTTAAFVEFKKKRQVYENKINDENREPGVNIAATSYRNSWEDYQLKTIWRAKWVTCDTWTSATEAQLKACVEARSKVDFDDAKLDVLDKVVKNVRMDMSIKGAETRVWSLVPEYEKELEKFGYSKIPEKLPHIAIGHMMDRLKPVTLKDKMKLVVRSRKHESLHQKYFQKIMKEVVARAKTIKDADAEVKPRHSGDTFSSDANDDGRRAAPGGSRRHKALRGNHSGRRGKKSFEPARGAASDDSDRGTSAATKRPLASCLSPSCNKKHFLKDCKETSEQEKKVLIEEYRKQKDRAARFQKDNKGKKEKLICLGADSLDNYSTLFSATFCKGAIESVVMVDGGADVNVIPPKLFDAILNSSPATKVITLSEPRLFNQASEGAPQVSCERLITTDIELSIRHGTYLLLCSVQWAVGDSSKQHTLIGRPLLEALGIQTKKVEKIKASHCESSGAPFATSPNYCVDSPRLAVFPDIAHAALVPIREASHY